MQSFPKPLSSEEEAYYLSRYQDGDMDAKNILVEKNLRLVAHIVKKYASSGRDTDELIAIGIVGLVKAVNTFKADKGSRLGTYAARCIDNELLMMLRTERKLNREISLYEPIGTDKEGNEILVPDTNSILLDGETEESAVVSHEQKKKVEDDQTPDVPAIFADWKKQEGLSW